MQRRVYSLSSSGHVQSGMELTLGDSGALGFPPEFAELFVREEPARP